MKKTIHTTALALMFATAALAQNGAPAPVGPLPTPHQVAWQQMETYAFIHFGPNTFGDREWGYGDADPLSFDPLRLDCDQWARTVAEAGMKGIILTAKHHDGFCLWPSKYTDYSVRNSGIARRLGDSVTVDIVGQLADACRRHGLKLGLYLSPWDRHQAFYGTPLYVEYFHAQLNELLTQYGELFEVWFDGANGGDGWYGGAREKRHIDRRTYYNYTRAHETIFRLQPQAIIFSDGGPGCRWVGNEEGHADATNWSLLRIEDVYPGYEHYKELQSGHADGNKWVASECNTSIRPGWFYHEREDSKVKSVADLTDLYYRSVGHNGTFLLNFPVDKDGLIHPIDSAHAVDYHRQVASELQHNLLQKARITASATRSAANGSGAKGSKKGQTTFGVANLTDGQYDTYWATPDGMTSATLTIDLKKKQTLNRLMLQEYIPLGQRVERFTVEYQDAAKQWQPIRVNEATTTIGYKRLLRFKPITTARLRIRFDDARGPLCINGLGAYYAPNALERYDENGVMLRGQTGNEREPSLPCEVKSEQNGTDFLVDMGQPTRVSSLHYKPAADGMIVNYEIFAGNSPDDMRLIASGEFSNIRNNPIMQDVYFATTRARYLRLRAARMVNDGETARYERIEVR